MTHQRAAVTEFLSYVHGSCLTIAGTVATATISKGAPAPADA